MKKAILFCLLLGLTYWACNEDVSTIGTGMIPDQDKIGVYTDTVYLEASTIKLDSIYAKSINGLLGEFYDPVYGNLRSSFICQFYAPQTNLFPDTVINNKIDSISLNIYYYVFLGDSLTPMEASVYPVVKPLDKHYYTNVDPAKYCDMSQLYGKKTYTARDSFFYANSFYERYISIKLPLELGQKFFNEWKKPAPNAYSSLEAFTAFFPGVYIANTFGSGRISYVDFTEIGIYYNTLETGKDVSGNDSTYTVSDSTMFNVTKEIIQLNSYKNTHDAQLLVPNDERTYIKTPAGVFTKVTIPIPEIIKKIGNKKFNNAKLSLMVYGKEDTKYPLPFPGNGASSETVANKMLLIKQDSVIPFFENQQVADFRTSFTTTLSNYVYDFGNISGVIQDAINNEATKDKNLELLVIPVQTTTSSGMDYTTSHYLAPSGVTLKKGKEYLKLAITATDAQK